MSGPVVFQMWMLLLLGSTHEVVRAHVSPAQVIRRNVRSDDGNHLTTDLYRKEETISVTPLGGIIHSPRYPNAYPRCLLLSWKLLSPPGTRIHLEFDRHFNLEEGENGVCRYDFIEVEDQSETSTIIWGRWCGERAPPTVISKTNALKVTFKSDDYFVAKPGFKIYYTMMHDSPHSQSKTNWEPVTLSSPHELAYDEGGVPEAVTEAPLSLEDLDQTIAIFDTIEDLLKTLNPDTWKQDLDNIYTQPYIQYRSRAYHLMSRHNKVDLNRLYDDVKRYSCTPRNYSVNLREELRVTNAVFFPRCLLVKRCGGNCGCGTDNWNSGCTCQAAKTTLKLHEVLKYAPEANLSQRHRRPKVRWVIDEVFLTHHEKCECACPSQPPR